jgi:hypothetical protein
MWTADAGFHIMTNSAAELQRPSRDRKAIGSPFSPNERFFLIKYVTQKPDVKFLIDKYKNAR